MNSGQSHLLTCPSNLTTHLLNPPPLTLTHHSQPQYELWSEPFPHLSFKPHHHLFHPTNRLCFYGRTWCPKSRDTIPCVSCSVVPALIQGLGLHATGCAKFDVWRISEAILQAPGSQGRQVWFGGMGGGGGLTETYDPDSHEVKNSFNLW